MSNLKFPPRTIGVYRVNGTYASDFPQDADKVSSVMYVTAGQNDGYVTQQLFVPTNSGGSLWIRRVDSSGNTSPWLRCDNYGTTSLAGLASALGAYGKHDNSGLANVLNINRTGSWLSDDSTLNKPAAGYYFIQSYYLVNDIYVLWATKNDGSTAYFGLIRDGNVIWHKVATT